MDPRRKVTSMTPALGLGLRYYAPHSSVEVDRLIRGLLVRVSKQLGVAVGTEEIRRWEGTYGIVVSQEHQAAVYRRDFLGSSRRLHLRLGVPISAVLRRRNGRYSIVGQVAVLENDRVDWIPTEPWVRTQLGHPPRTYTHPEEAPGAYFLRKLLLEGIGAIPRGVGGSAEDNLMGNAPELARWLNAHGVTVGSALAPLAIPGGTYALFETSAADERGFWLVCGLERFSYSGLRRALRARRAFASAHGPSRVSLALLIGPPHSESRQLWTFPGRPGPAGAPAGPASESGRFTARPRRATAG